jgi:glucose-1-phosphate thymidylyltransferase
VRGPAIIGADAEIVDAYIGPFTSIGPGCRIERTEIEHSVVLERCVVTDISRIEGSLLGREVTITTVATKPAAHRFHLGDHSQVEVQERR